MDLKEQSLERFIHRDETAGTAQLFLVVQGIHCGGCVNRVERHLAKVPGVIKARLNLSTHRLDLVWDPKQQTAQDLLGSLEDLGYPSFPYDQERLKKQTNKEARFFLSCLAVAGFAMGNVMMLSIAQWLGFEMQDTTRTILRWIAGAIALPAVLFAGRPFFYSAGKALLKRTTNMDVPISIAIVLTLGISVFQTLRQAEHVYFEAATMLVFFLLIGRYFDQKMRSKAQATAQNLLMLQQKEAVVVEKGQSKVVPIEDLTIGAVVLVEAGQRIPADGTIVEGKGDLDTSLVTGESRPQAVEVGMDVYAGVLNLSAPLFVKVTALAQDSLLAEIGALVEQAGQSKSTYVRWADRMARLYAPLVHSLALLTFLGWMLLGAGWEHSLIVAVSVLIITCPCALGLAVPVVQVIVSGILFQKSVLLKTGDALERLTKVRLAIFDKTGTLTEEKALLEDKDYDPEAVRLGYHLAMLSHHPLAKALVKALKERLDPEDLKAPLVFENVEEIAGEGLKAFYQGEEVRLGRRSFCGLTEEEGGYSEICLVWGDTANTKEAIFYFKQNLRTSASAALEGLKGQNIDLLLMSGDREGAVQKVAQHLDIPAVGACKPQDKIAYVEAQQAQGIPVLMVGDGINDAPALSAAEVSMTLAHASEISQVASDFILQGKDLAVIPFAYRMAKISKRLIFQNFALAALYNIVAIPIAMMGLVTPWLAALFMSLSSLVVTCNALRAHWLAKAEEKKSGLEARL